MKQKQTVPRFTVITVLLIFAALLQLTGTNGIAAEGTEADFPVESDPLDDTTSGDTTGQGNNNYESQNTEGFIESAINSITDLL